MKQKMKGTHMDYDVQEIFQPEQVNMDLEQYLRSIASVRNRPERKQRTTQANREQVLEEELWDWLGDFA